MKDKKPQKEKSGETTSALAKDYEDEKTPFDDVMRQLLQAKPQPRTAPKPKAKKRKKAKKA